MLALLALAMIVIFMILIMTRRLSALVALIIIPPLVGLAAGAGEEIGSMMFEGVRTIAPTGIMLIFGILYFGVMIDAGVFEPIVRRIVRFVDCDPLRLTVGTVVLTLLVSLDGDGSTTYMITASALLPLYHRLEVDPRIMACLIIMSSAVMNLLPWGGPTARAAAVSSLDAGDVFVGLLPAMAVTAAWVLFVAWRFGMRERARLASHDAPSLSIPSAVDMHVATAAPTKLFWFNALLTILLLVLLVLGILPLAILFMLAFAIALAVNYPSQTAQRERFEVHAANALSVGGLVFGAGILVGILSGTGMDTALASSITGAVPAGWGSALAHITAALSVPFTFLISNDAFYFGVLPILTEAGGRAGIPEMDMARASLVGQQLHLLSPLVPSTYLLVTLSGIDFGSHQKFTLPWALGSCTVFFVACMLFGIF